MVRTEQISRCAEWVRAASRITVLTGAGVSAASGVPTFRGSGGLWRNYSPHQLATPEAFRSDPKTVWEWYNWRRERIAGCRPNAAHQTLSTWSRRYPVFRVITQNVDGLHEKADTRNVIRFHGSIWEVLCWQRCPDSPSRWIDETVPFPIIPPACPHCGGLLRPGVVWFGEGIDPAVMERSLEALTCDLFLSIGTSAVVYPAAGFIHEARARGARTVEINPDATPFSPEVDLVLQAPAEEALLEVEATLLKKANPEQEI